MAIENGSSGFVGLARLRRCCLGIFGRGSPSALSALGFSSALDLTGCNTRG